MDNTSTVSQTANHGKSKDEEDLQERSTKFKDNNLQDMDVTITDGDGEKGDHGGGSGEKRAATKSYREMVTGADDRVDNEADMEGSDQDSDDDDLNETDIEGIRVEEQKIGSYDCPIFVLSK
jgi:hypothetical protein